MNPITQSTLIYSLWFGAIISLICAVYAALILRRIRKKYSNLNKQEEINGNI